MNALQKMAWQYLEKLYELSQGGFQPEVDYERAISELGLHRDEMRPIHNYLESKDFISWKCRVGRVRITTRGIDVMQNSYEEKERRVFQRLYDERETRHTRSFTPAELAQELNLNVNEVTEIINELESQGWLGGTDEGVSINAAGIKEIERKAEPARPTIVINNPQNSPMSFGTNSNQTVSYNNQPVQEILPDLSRLIEDLHALDFPTRGDVIGELQKVESLAKGEMNAGTWELIQARLVTTKTALELAKIAADSVPYWPVVWNYFFK